MRAALAAVALAAVVAAGSVAAARSLRGGGHRTLEPSPHLDLQQSLGRPAPFLRRFDLAALNPSTDPDAIRAIDHPVFERPAAARALLPPTSLVVGLALGGDVHAYPVDLLSLHEVVNDVVGGKPVAITWCPLCASALAFERRIGGRVLTFGVSGYLYRANQILFDRETGSLWSQLLGGAVTGVHRGLTLRPVPIVTETWADWLGEHPGTLVLSIKRDARSLDFTRPYSYVTTYGIEESDQPYGAYASKVPVYFPRVVHGIQDGARVLGVVVAGRAKAYPLSALQRRRVVNDALAGRPILVTYDADALSASVYSRRLEGRTLTFRLAGRLLVDRETGSRWSPRNGTARTGPLAGAQLAHLPSTTPYWFAWRAFHPDTSIAIDR